MKSETIKLQIDDESPSLRIPLARWQVLCVKLLRIFQTWPDESRENIQKNMEIPLDTWLASYTHSSLPAKVCAEYAPLIRRLAGAWLKNDDLLDEENYRTAYRVADFMQQAANENKPINFYYSN